MCKQDDLSFMQSLAKALKTAKIDQRRENKNFKAFCSSIAQHPTVQQEYLQQSYFFNRTVKGQLPTLEKHKVVNRHKEARQNEKKRQEYNEKFTNSKNSVKKSDIKVGDSVLVKQQR